MFELRIEVEFPAGHQLRGYVGDCAKPHGHNWIMEVFVRSRALDQVGMAVDFRLLKKAAKETVAAWDHSHLNDLPEFRSTNPTAENLAKVAFEKLSVLLEPTPGVNPCWVDRVTVWENARCSATYFGSATQGWSR